MKQLGLVGVVVTTALVMAGAASTPVIAAPTRAPTAEEQKAFAEGLRAYDSGDARAAERAWKAGYSIARDPAFLVRIGEAQEKAGAPRDALQSYEQYLRESPDAADRADIEARVRRLAPPRAASPVEVETPGELGGSSAPGAAPSSAGGPATTATPVPGAPSAPAPQVRDDSHEDLVPLVEEEPPHSRMNIAAWVGTGVTAALLGSAAFFGARAAERSGDANRLLLYFDKDTGVPQEYAAHAQEFEDDVRVGKRDDRLAKLFVAAAGVTAIASAVLFVLDARAEKPTGGAGVGKHAGAGSGGAVRFSATATSLRWSF